MAPHNKNTHESLAAKVLCCCPRLSGCLPAGSLAGSRAGLYSASLRVAVCAVVCRRAVARAGEAGMAVAQVVAAVVERAVVSAVVVGLVQVVVAVAPSALAAAKRRPAEIDGREGWMEDWSAIFRVLACAAQHSPPRGQTRGRRSLQVGAGPGLPHSSAPSLSRSAIFGARLAIGGTATAGDCGPPGSSWYPPGGRRSGSPLRSTFGGIPLGAGGRRSWRSSLAAVAPPALPLAAAPRPYGSRSSRMRAAGSRTAWAPPRRPPEPQLL